MSEEVLDHLDIDLTGVELTRPQIDNQVTEVTIAEAKAYPAGGDRGRHLDLDLVLEEPATSTLNNPLPVGKKMQISLLLDPTGGMDQKRINEELGAWKAAALGERRVEGPFGAVSQLVGKRVKVKWTVSKTGYQNAKPLVMARS